MIIKIGIAYHQKGDFYNKEPFIPIQLGAELHEDWGIQKDNEGDNISCLNPYCCELTATYWLWKNIKADYKGLFHYRRFLSFKPESFFSKIPRLVLYYLSKIASVIVRDSRYSLMCFPFFKIRDVEVNKTLDTFAKEIEQDVRLNGYDCYALGKIKHSTNTKGKGLERLVGYLHLNKALSIIEDYYPEFSPWFEKTLNSNFYYACNIIIAKNEVYEDYCRTMFGILEKYHAFMNKGIKVGEVNNSMLRDSGYLAEIITSAYILKLEETGYNVRHLGLTQVDISTDESQKGTPIRIFIKQSFERLVHGFIN